MSLIEECSNISLRIQKLEALINGRLAYLHPIWPEVMNEYKRRLAGQRGEKSMYFHLSMLSESKYQIYHGIRLLYRGFYFQIDFLVLCGAFALVLEVKNRSGELEFEKEFNQVTCKKNGQKERINNPVSQAKLQARKLRGWLRDHNIELPVHYLFVNSNEKTIILSDPGNEHITRHICNSETLLEKMDQLEHFHKEEKLDAKELRKLRRLLLSRHTPENPDILKQFHLSPKEDILPGVICPTCRFLPMNYHYGSWCCPKCNLKSKTAHIPAINDHFLLIKPSITSAELRAFLLVSSPSVGGKILASMNLPFSGTFRNRVYFSKKKK
ncbi:nuclease-related domain-containing protein [Neobacillus soli]|nr:nuclease-related domain-containing protein [Neobacillus soli]